VLTVELLPTAATALPVVAVDTQPTVAATSVPVVAAMVTPATLADLSNISDMALDSASVSMGLISAIEVDTGAAATTETATAVATSATSSNVSTNGTWSK